MDGDIRDVVVSSSFMGIKNARRRSHSSPVEGSHDEDRWQEGTFEPAPDSERQRTLLSPIRGDNGLPTEGSIVYVEWKKGPDLQKFYGCIQIGYDPDSDGDIEIPDDDEEHIPDSAQRNACRKWSGAEIDCTHGVCHIHPNGHYPPSGVPEPKIPIKQLHSVKDVREARGVATIILRKTAETIAHKHGGDFSERNVADVSRTVTQSAV